jgi:hypothetical protein
MVNTELKLKCLKIVGIPSDMVDFFGGGLLGVFMSPWAAK